MAVLNPGHGKTGTGRFKESSLADTRLGHRQRTRSPIGKETADEANPHRQAPRRTGQLAANATAARRARP